MDKDSKMGRPNHGYKRIVAQSAFKSDGELTKFKKMSPRERGKAFELGSKIIGGKNER